MSRQRSAPYLFSCFQFLLAGPLCSLLLRVLDPLQLSLVESRQVFFASTIIKRYFFNSRCSLSFLVWWRQRTFLGSGFGKHNAHGQYCSRDFFVQVSVFQNSHSIDAVGDKQFFWSTRFMNFAAWNWLWAHCTSFTKKYITVHTPYSTYLPT